MANEFSCCAFYAECNYGRNECYFSQTEPDKKQRCRCYQLKKEKRGEYVQELIRTEKLESETTEKTEMEQLSLF
jgi:hypothetical protein